MRSQENPGWHPERSEGSQRIWNMMKFGITYRLFLSILGATALAILTLFLVMQWSLDRGFNQYLQKMDQKRLGELIEDLGKRFNEEGSWDFFRKGRRLKRGPKTGFRILSSGREN
jgi:two-component system sensor histidine kinase BaeS